MIDWIRHHANIRVVLPAAIALGMLGFVSSVAAAPRTGSQLLVIIGKTWVPILVLTFPYLAARALVWYRLLFRLGIEVPVPQAAVSFAAGEMTKSLPGGVYLENYLLGRLVRFGRHSLIRSSMATTAMLGLESLVAVPIALIVGVPGEPWVFWTLIGIVACWVAIIFVVAGLVRYWAQSSHGCPTRLQQLARYAQEFLDAGRDLLRPGTLVECVPTAIYMLVYVIDLYAILLAAGVHSITFVDVMGMYAIIVLAVILVPIPTEIGITEFTGLGVLLAYGVPRATAALVILSLRLLATGMTIIVAGGILLLLHDELRTIERVGALSDQRSAIGDG